MRELDQCSEGEGSDWSSCPEEHFQREALRLGRRKGPSSLTWFSS